MLRAVFALFFSGLKLSLFAQVTADPIFPKETDKVVFTFNAAEGNKGLMGETDEVYAHSGVITDKSTGNSDWKYVKFPWTTNDPSMLLKRISPDVYTLTINNIREFYGVPVADKIKKITFVFRNATRTKEGKATGNADIFYDVTEASAPLSVLLTSPKGNIFVNKNENIQVVGTASGAANLTLTDNGVQIASATNATQLSHTIVANTEGVHTVVFKAVSGTQTAETTFQYVIQPTIKTENPPANAELGANLTQTDTVLFTFQAPIKKNVYLIGSFNDFKIDDKYLMNRGTDATTWWLKVALPNGTHTYQYLVDGNLRVADPLSSLVLDPDNDRFIPAVTYPNLPAYPTGKTTGHVSVLEKGKTPYTWKVNNFKRPAKRDLVIYELLVRDFVARHDFQTIIDSLPYFKRLGINALQFMPLNEFDGNESWGYNPAFHMAIDKYYGTADKFKELVDKCHENGIAVILDVVFNHATGASPLIKLFADGFDAADNNPWANKEAKHPYNVFSDLNHESALTKAYVERCIKYWLTEYKLDGYRFDLSKGFTQKNTLKDEAEASRLDPSRVAILKNYNNVIQSTTPGAYTILEHFTENDEETQLAADGMLVWAEATYDFNEASMGWNFDISWGSALSSRRNWKDAKYDSHIAYMESHDKERLMFKNLKYGREGNNYSVKNLGTALKRQELVSTFFYGIPGPRMLWQFGELGYDFNINYPSSDDPEGEKDRLTKKPIRWDYLNVPERKRLFDVTSNLLHLRKTQTVFQTTNYNVNELSGKKDSIKAFHLEDANLSVTILGNFDVAGASVNPAFQKTGMWYNYMTGDSLNVANATAPIQLLPGEYRIYTSKKLPTPPAGFVRFLTSTPEFAAQVNEFLVYPNPSVSAASNATFVGFNLKKEGKVRFSVFNALGQVVEQSPNTSLPTGSHQLGIQSKLSAGIYFIRLDVNGASATRKLVID